METFFNLENPIEKAIYKNLLEYTETDMTPDQVLGRLGKEFPFMSDELRRQCESAVFKYADAEVYEGTAAEFKDMVLLHSDMKDEPFYSNIGRCFRLRDNHDDDVLISIMVENKHFQHSEAQVHYVIYADDVQVGEINETLDKMERRKIYTLPLHILQKGLMEGSRHKSLNIRIEDRNIEGKEYRCGIEVFHGEASVEDAFDPYFASVTFEYDEPDTDINGYRYEDWLCVRANARYKEETYGELHELEASVVLVPDDPDMIDFTYIFPLYMAERYDCPNDMCIDCRIPIDKVAPGDYNLLIEIWDDLLHAEKVTIFAPVDEDGEPEPEETESDQLSEPDDFDKLLEGFLEEFLANNKICAFVQMQLLDDENNVVSSEAGEFIRILKEPTKLRTRILFDSDWENEEDIQIMVRAMGWHYPIRFTLTSEEIKEADGKPIERVFLLSGRELENFKLLYMEMNTASGNQRKSFDYTVVRFNSPYDILDLQGLYLYNLLPDSDPYDYSAPSRTAFKAESLKTLSVLCKFTNVHDLNFLGQQTEMIWNLYSATGVLLETFTSDFSNTETFNALAKFGEFNDYVWEKGEYRLELKWFQETMLSALFKVGDQDIANEYDPLVIRRKEETIQEQADGLSALERLDRMAGLEDIKKKVHSFVNYTKLQQKRKEAGLPTKQPALHARFLGNPGTGKTTVAKLLGQIYKELGLLSSGHVVVEERKNFIGRYYDSEGSAVDNALSRAKGGILLIDEAYNLYVENDEKDPGRRVLEYLLTALSDENNRDWMLILAGYPKEMERMLDSNPGLKSRVSDEFTFKDYDVDTLMEIAEIYCQDNSYILSEEGRKMLRAAISFEFEHKDRHFGNGRYVNKFLDTVISTNMATRISAIESPTKEQLMTIEAEDIVIDSKDAIRISGQFDEDAIDEALKRLDALVGLNKVKSAIHNFVNVARYLNSQGERFTGKGLLKWNFTGSTGTGKSTVAQILADILKAMNLIQSNEVTEIKGEEIFNVSEYTCNETLKEAAKKNQKGMLHIDADAPEFRSREYRMTNEMVRIKLTNLIQEDNSAGALIISECSSPKQSIAYTLANNGVYDYDHIFIFDDYTEEELYQILLQCLEKYRLTMSEEAECSLKEYIRNLCINRELSFANARTMKTLSRAIYEIVLLRLSKEKQTSDERIILGCDVESFVWKKVGSNRIGF